MKAGTITITPRQRKAEAPAVSPAAGVWRELPDADQPPPEEPADREHAVACWGGVSEIGRRIEALRR